MPCLKFSSADNPQSPRGLGGRAVFKKIICIILVCACLVSFSCLSVSAATDGYIDLPVSFNNSWLDGYGVIQPDTHQGSRFEYDLPTEHYTNGTILSTQYYYTDNNVMTSYNDFLFKVSTFNIACERVYLSFYQDSNEYEFKLDSTDNVNCYYSLELNDFNWKNNIFSINFVFETRIDAQAAQFVVENMYYKISDTSIILGNQNANTDREIQADKENTQSIIDNQNQLAEQEKAEIESSGNDSVDDVSNAIPKYDLISAVSSFVGAFESTDTTCIFEVPQIYIPDLGIIPRTVLYSGGSIDLEKVVNMIPSEILTLVQYLLTISLILFCFKEFYDLLFSSVDGVAKIGDDV